MKTLTIEYSDSSAALPRLKSTWLKWTLGVILGLMGGFLMVSQFWQTGEAIGWAVLSSGFMIYQLVFLRLNLRTNRAADEANLNPNFGWANWFSIVRGLLLALLFGFAAGPWPVGWLAWVPGMLYLVASIMDFSDGFIARITNQETILGERLDMSLDGMGVLAGTWVAIHYGQLPVWFLLVGLARYFFLLGGWLVERSGTPLRPLKPNPYRRAMAGTQMGFIPVVLLPIYYPPVTSVAAILFAAPFLVNFLSDWLWVSGFSTTHFAFNMKLSNSQTAWIKLYVPLFFRFVLAVLLLCSFFGKLTMGWIRAGLLVALAGISFGLAGRVMALAVVLLTGLLLKQSPSMWLYWLQLTFGTAVFFNGTGPFSVWVPENWLIHQRAGEKDQS
jgi:CDP-diacylglycerol--glycerol-3-phosphate 3-phosphatidyltransferase